MLEDNKFKEELYTKRKRTSYSTDTCEYNQMIKQMDVVIKVKSPMKKSTKLKPLPIGYKRKPKITEIKPIY